MKIAVFGLWHLGCVTAACLAQKGHHVTGIDPDAKRIANLASGRSPIAEPGLETALREGISAGSLRVTTDLSALEDV